MSRTVFASVLLAVPFLSGAEGEVPTAAFEADALARELGAADFVRRESAFDRLRRMGEPAVPAVTRALESDDPEVRAAAEKLLPLLEAVPPEVSERMRRAADVMRLTRDIREASRAYGDLRKEGWPAARVLASLFPGAEVPPGSCRLVVKEAVHRKGDAASRWVLSVENAGKEPVWLSVNGFEASVGGFPFEALCPENAPCQGDYDLLHLEGGGRRELAFLGKGFQMKGGAPVRVRYRTPVRVKESADIFLDRLLEGIPAERAGPELPEAAPTPGLETAWEGFPPTDAEKPE